MPTFINSLMTSIGVVCFFGKFSDRHHRWQCDRLAHNRRSAAKGYGAGSGATPPFVLLAASSPTTCGRHCFRSYLPFRFLTFRPEEFRSPDRCVALRDCGVHSEIQSSIRYSKPLRERPKRRPLPSMGFITEVRAPPVHSARGIDLQGMLGRSHHPDQPAFRSLTPANDAHANWDMPRSWTLAATPGRL